MIRRMACRKIRYALLGGYMRVGLLELAVILIVGGVVALKYLPKIARNIAESKKILKDGLKEEVNEKK